MKRKLVSVLAAVVLATASAFVGNLPARAEVNPYITEGTHHVNGRDWRTACEPYSQTKRCRAEIWATHITEVNGRFVTKNQWVFNNLTYLPAPRALWTGNRLAYTNKWTATDGRRWYTECDTPVTGGNGCRSYAEATVISRTKMEGKWVHRRYKTFVFNNIVMFSAAPPSAVQGVTAYGGGGSDEIVVTWDPLPPTQMVDRYRVYLVRASHPNWHVTDIFPDSIGRLGVGRLGVVDARDYFPRPFVEEGDSRCYVIAAVARGVEGPPSAKSCGTPS